MNLNAWPQWQQFCPPVRLGDLFPSEWADARRHPFRRIRPARPPVHFSSQGRAFGVLPLPAPSFSKF